MKDAATFAYLPVPGTGAMLPLLAVVMENEARKLEAHGLVDSGATVNVLPHSLGLQLGLVWGEQKHTLELGGILARHEARGVLLNVKVQGFAPVRLAFAWSAGDDVRLILGQTNFFLAFDITFRRADQEFDLTLR